METVITISGADKAGSLARLVVFLTHKGYRVKGQRIAELPSGARLLKMRIGLAQVDKEARRLAALLELASAEARGCTSIRRSGGSGVRPDSMPSRR